MGGLFAGTETRSQSQFFRCPRALWCPLLPFQFQPRDLCLHTPCHPIIRPPLGTTRLFCVHSACSFSRGHNNENRPQTQPQRWLLAWQSLETRDPPENTDKTHVTYNNIPIKFLELAILGRWVAPTPTANTTCQRDHAFIQPHSPKIDPGFLLPSARPGNQRITVGIFF